MSQDNSVQELLDKLHGHKPSLIKYAMNQGLDEYAANSLAAMAVNVAEKRCSEGAFQFRNELVPIAELIDEPQRCFGFLNEVVRLLVLANKRESQVRPKRTPKHKTIPLRNTDVPENRASADDIDERQRLNEERLTIALRFIAELPEDQRNALNWSVHHKLPYSEIAQKLGREVGAVKSLIYRARQELKRRFSNLGLED